MNDLNFLNIRENDCDSLDKFQKKYSKLLNNNIWNKNDLLELIKKKKIYGKICYRRRLIIGFCIAFKNINFLEIYSIFVRPSFRRLGIAEKIIIDCIKFCKKNSIQKIVLEVSEQNHEAKNLYFKNKFEICGERRGYYTQDKIISNALLLEFLVN